MSRCRHSCPPVDVTCGCFRSWPLSAWLVGGGRGMVQLQTRGRAYHDNVTSTCIYLHIRHRCIVAIIHNGDGMGKRVGHPFVCKDKPGCHRPRFDACSTFWVAEPECQTFRPCPGFPLRRCTWLYGSSKSCVVREAVPVVLPSVSFPWYP